MLSLRDLRFMLCSRDLDVLRPQRSTGFFYLNYPQSNGVRKPDHMYKLWGPSKAQQWSRAITLEILVCYGSTVYVVSGRRFLDSRNRFIISSNFIL